MQEVGTTPEEETTPPTLRQTTNPPTRPEAATPTREPGPLRNRC